MANISIFFNGNLVQQVSSQTHLGLMLNIFFTLDKHTKNASNINKTTSVAEHDYYHQKPINQIPTIQGIIGNKRFY